MVYSAKKKTIKKTKIERLKKLKITIQDCNSSYLHWVNITGILLQPDNEKGIH